MKNIFFRKQEKALLLLCFFLIFNSALFSQVLINEFQCNNTNFRINPNSGNFDDWIELYNPSDSLIEMGDWSISDNNSDMRKFIFRKGITIKPNSYLFLWANDDLDGYGLPFKLSDKGESLFLCMPDSSIADSLTYPNQFANTSYGRNFRDKQWCYQLMPSPGRTNTLSVCGKPTFAEGVDFSYKSGHYKQAFELTIAPQKAGTMVFYTTDGSIPCNKSIKYVAPITIEKTTVVRTITYTMGMLPGNVQTHTYLINENTKLPVVSLATNPDHLWDKDFGIYIEGDNVNEDDLYSINYFNEWERPAHFQYFASHDSAALSMETGIRIYGNSTRNFPQKSLALYAKKKYGHSKFDYPFFDNYPITKFKSILLRNSGNDWGNTMFLDGLTQNLVKNQLNVDIQAFQPTIVYLNGRYWGIHNIREKMNEHYLVSHYGIPKDSIDIIQPDKDNLSFEAKSGSADDFIELLEFVKEHDLSDYDVFSKVSEQIDIEAHIDYHIIQIYICNTDWVGKNVKIWRNGKNGQWRWMVYDTDFSFNIMYGQEKFDMFSIALATNHEKLTYNAYYTLLLRKLLDNKEFKKMFVQKFAATLNTVFAPERVIGMIDSLQNLIAPEMPRFYEKWGGITQDAFPFRKTCQNSVEWEKNVDIMRDFARARPMHIRQQLTERFQLPELAELEIKTQNPKGGQIKIMGIPLGVSEFKGQFFKHIPIEVEVKANEGYRFVGWKKEGNDRQIEVTLIGNKKLVAIFEEIKEG